MPAKQRKIEFVCLRCLGLLKKQTDLISKIGSCDVCIAVTTLVKVYE